MSIGYPALNVINAAKRVVRLQQQIRNAIKKKQPTDELADKRGKALARLENAVKTYEKQERRERDYDRNGVSVGS